jgi:hypothetical protein
MVFFRHYLCYPSSLQIPALDQQYWYLINPFAIRWAGVEDPKIMITTSRDPSSKLKQFAKVYQDFHNLEINSTRLTFHEH